MKFLGRENAINKIMFDSVLCKMLAAEFCERTQIYIQ